MPGPNRHAVRVWLLASVLLGSLSLAPCVSAHVVVGTKSLHLRVAESPIIVRGRVVDPQELFVSEDGRGRRALVRIEILEVLKGDLAAAASAEPAPIRFVQDGHEAARYRVGDEALFFLAPIAASRELRALAVPGGPSHVSSQEHDEAFRLSSLAPRASPSAPGATPLAPGATPLAPGATPVSGAKVESAQARVLLDAVRDLIASEMATTADQRVSLIRHAILALLTSGDPQLGASALASLVLAPNAPLLATGDLPRLEAFLAARSAPIGLRAGLIAELERRDLIDAPRHWRALIDGARPSELGAALRAVGPHPSRAVTTILLEILADPERATGEAAEAALALGAAGDRSAVPALVAALERPDARLRGAAIRALGQIGGADAQNALEEAARSHEDAPTRRRALAEVRKHATRSARAEAARSRERLVD